MRFVFKRHDDVNDNSCMRIDQNYVSVFQRLFAAVEYCAKKVFKNIMVAMLAEKMGLKDVSCTVS